MWERYREYIIAFCSNLTAGVVVFTIVQSAFIAVIFLIILLAMTFLTLRLISFMRVGLKACASHRKDLSTLVNCVRLAKTSLDYLGVIPMAHVQTTEIIDEIEKKAKMGSFFRLLLLDPTSEHAKKRRNDGGAFTLTQLHDIRNDLQERLTKLGDDRTNLEVKYYNEYPVWCIGIIDKSECFLSFYGRKKAGVNWPALLIKKGENTFYEACSLQFEKLWEKAKPL